MFDFHSKKKFLVDYLNGFTDIHNHILPAIDDGAKNVEESVYLIKGMGDFGVTDFIATPHIMENYYPNTAGTIKTAQSFLENALKMEGLDNVTIRVAAEHMIDSGFEALLDTNGIMPISKQYILIEMSYLQASLNFEKSVDQLREKGLFPIFAHPERYMYLKRNKGDYRRLKDTGMMFQLNLLSLSGYYGKEVHKKAIYLLEDNLIDFVGTDLHHKNHLKHLKQVQISPKVLKMVMPLIERTSYNFNSRS